MERTSLSSSFVPRPLSLDEPSPPSSVLAELLERVPVRAEVGDGLTLQGLSMSEQLADVQADAQRLLAQAHQEALEQVSQRRIGGAILGWLKGVGRVLERAVGAVFDTAMLAVGELATRLPAGPGGVQPRPLNGQERAALSALYGDALDLDAVRLGSSRVMTVGMDNGGRAVGNGIYLTRQHFDENGALRLDSLDLFMHEAAHVYQFQRGGADYLHRAVFPRVRTSEHDMYEWSGPLQRQQPIASLNPEQQAELLTGINWFLHRHPERDPATPFRPGDLFSAGEGGPRVVLDSPMVDWLHALRAQVSAGIDPRWMS